MAEASKELSKIGERFPALAEGGSEILQIVQANVGDGELNIFDLDGVNIPGGGATSWEVPGLEGPQSVRELEGVIVAWRSPRMFYRKSIDETGGGEAPDCSSPDNTVGDGEFGPGSKLNPSGRCDSCPMNEWGSADGGEGKGKACREMRQLFMLLEGSVLPITVTVPPTSIKPLRKFMLRLASEGILFHSVTVKLTLQQEQDGGKKWSTMVPALGERLTPEQSATARSLGEQLEASMSAPAPSAPTEATATDK